MINKIDKGTTFFFDLEKKNGKSKQITHLIQVNGNVIDNPDLISQHVRDYYYDLFTPKLLVKENQHVLLSGMKHISEEQRIMCGKAITFKELTIAMETLAIDKSPGIDGFPVNFYRHFWDTLGHDFFNVVLFSLQKGEFPISCRRAILSLLPKSGNNGYIKNWRPISLLCSDYKKFAKLITLRLKKVLPSIIHVTQSYAIEKRRIHDNVHMMRDVISFANSTNCPLSILSLDQQKAFDRINHDYLYMVLKIFGFSEYFISCVKLMYKGAQALIKINSKLLSPIEFNSGVKQGDPSSAALYCLALEPFLVHLRNKMEGHGLNVLGHSFITSAYADDLCIICTKDEGFEIVNETLELYTSASSAKVNFVKSIGLWCGSWRERKDSPLGLKWTNKGIKYLGVFLGNTVDFEKNRSPQLRMK